VIEIHKLFIYRSVEGPNTDIAEDNAMSIPFDLTFYCYTNDVTYSVCMIFSALISQHFI